MYLLSMQRRHWLLQLLYYLVLIAAVANALIVNSPTSRSPKKELRRYMASASGEQGFGGGGVFASKMENDDIATLSALEIKQRLLDLLPSMTGKDHEFRLVESYVNALEEAYVPAQTLEFFNFAMTGEWQLLFSTNLLSAGCGPKPNFRLRELLQRVESNQLRGDLVNVALWDLAEDGGMTFDVTGTFSVKCTYQIHQGARMVVNLEDLILEPSMGSNIIPSDVPSLVGMLHRAMPKEMFDPNDHAMDTTYLDGDLRIVRLTGPKFEGVRDIFMRRGSMEINPTNG